MSRSSRKSQLVVFGTHGTPAVQVEKGDRLASAKRNPVEAEHEVLLQLMPDHIFRIKAKQDGTIAVMDGRTRIRIATDQPVEGMNSPVKESRLVDPVEGLGQQLACHGKQLIDRFLGTGEIQTLEIQAKYGGRTVHYQVRAAACASWELLAVVTDVTARKEAEICIAKSLSEVARLNEILQNEASLHAEDEQIMDNAFAKLGKLLEDTIGAMQMIVQQKDPPTALHQARVCRLACAIGREMGLEKGQVDTIGLAALLHDLGKVFVSTETLNKPGKLTEEEFSEVKNSTETEFRILKTIDLFYPIADIVHQHHERLDGSGYPLGLKGDDILIEARIIAVADVVEAMMSERPYRAPLPLDAVLHEVESGKGTLYDANAVDACITIFKEGRFTFDLADTELPLEEAYSGA